MREDMAKIIVERPRFGGGTKYPRAAGRSDSRRPLEDMPRRVSPKRPWAEDGARPKGLNENLAPLRRYLRSQVGRPWDKVYSEIRQRINPASAVQLHIWQHLVEYVCTDPSVVCGDVSARTALGLRISSDSFRFYVDPRCGLLRANPRYGWRPSSRPAWPGPSPATERGWVEVDDERCLALVDGLWFELTLRPFAPGRERAYDHLLRRDAHVGSGDPWRYRGRRVHVAAKRQLGKREIRRLGLPAAGAGGADAAPGELTRRTRWCIA